MSKVLDVEQVFEGRLVHDGRPVIQEACPFCGRDVDGSQSTVGYGGDRLHSSCFDQFGVEMNTAFPDVLSPIDPEEFPSPEDDQPLFDLERDFA